MLPSPAAYRRSKYRLDPQQRVSVRTGDERSIAQEDRNCGRVQKLLTNEITVGKRESRATFVVPSVCKLMLYSCNILHEYDEKETAILQNEFADVIML